MNIKVTVDDTEYSGINKLVVAGKEMDLTGTPNLQTKTATENGTYTADTGYDGLNQVTVNIPSGVGFVGTAINSDGFNTEAIIRGVANMPEYYLSGAGFMQLTSLTINGDIESIGVNALSGYTLSNLKTAEFNGDVNISNKIFQDSLNLETITFNGDVNVSYEDYLFNNCDSLTSITFNGDVTSDNIFSMFYRCDKLSELVFNGYATISGDLGTDSDTPLLTSVNFPNGVTLSRVSSNIKDIIVGNGTTNIDYLGDGNIETLTIGNGTVTLGPGEQWTNYSNLTSIVIGNNSTAPKVSTTIDIVDGFSRCSVLESVYINNGTFTYNGTAGLFENCSSLTDVTISGMTTIPDCMFKYCSSLTEIPDLINSVTSIGSEAFADSGLTGDIDIPSNVTSIGDKCFENCNITSVTLNADTTTFTGQPFAYSSITSLYILGDVLIQSSDSSHSISGSDFPFSAPNLTDLYVSWGENDYAGAPWGAPFDVNIHYNYGNEPS